MNDEQPREKNVALGRARQRDLARRGLIGFHKRKRTDDAGVVVDEQASELQAYEYDKKAITLTNPGAIIIADGIQEFAKPCPDANPDETFIATAFPQLEVLPGTAIWTLYRMPNFMEAGKIIELIIRATYNVGAIWHSMPFYLLRRHPNDPLFVQEDIIYYNPTLPIAPPFTTPSHPWATWLDTKIDESFIYPFPRIAGQAQSGGPITNLATIYSLYILCAQWSGALGGEIMRVYLTVEDRGRE